MINVELLNKFNELVAKQKAYMYVLTLAGWDSATEAPKGAFQRRAEMLGVISGELFNLLTNQEYQDVVNGLFERLDELDNVSKKEIKKAKKGLDKVINIPKNYQKDELTNGYLIRRAAVDFNVMLITNRQIAMRLIEALVHLDFKNSDKKSCFKKLRIKSWDEYQ